MRGWRRRRCAKPRISSMSNSFCRVAVDVIVDDDLQAQRHVIEQDHDEGRHQDRVQGCDRKASVATSWAPIRPSTETANQSESGTSAAAVTRWRQKCVGAGMRRAQALRPCAAVFRGSLVVAPMAGLGEREDADRPARSNAAITMIAGLLARRHRRSRSPGPRPDGGCR